MRRIIYNDDSQGVHEARPGHARSDLEAWVDQALTLFRIDTYVWCICYPDIAMYRTRVGEVYGARFTEPPDAAAAVIVELHGEETDVLDVVAARARDHGVEFIAGMRMNDTHGMYPDPDDPQMSRFLIDHPEYVVARRDGIHERALDYSHPEVREHRLAILGELAEKYDIDGVELDFTRWAKFFAREEAPFKADIMSEFVATARAILDGAAAAD